jgi:hypothetical protein
MRLSDERSAVIVIRAWREVGSADGHIVARIWESVGLSERGCEESTVAGEAAIVAAVRDWLRAIDGG